MLTTIKALRDTHADQSRVTRVLNALKKKWPDYTEAMPFPVAFIMISNGAADTKWVLQSGAAFKSIAGFTAKNSADVEDSLNKLGLPFNDAPASITDAQQIINVYATSLAGCGQLAAAVAATKTHRVTKAVPKASAAKAAAVKLAIANLAGRTKEGFKIETKPAPKTKAAPKPKVAKTVISNHEDASKSLPPNLTVAVMATQFQAMTKRDKLAVLRLLAARTKKTLLVANPESKDSRKPTIVTIVL